MFFKTSFVTWRNYMRKFLTRQRWQREVDQERVFCERIGKPFVEPKYQEANERTIGVEIEYEEQIHLSASEDEHDDVGAISSKRPHTSQRFSECFTGKKSESPEVFRMKAKLRMMSSSRKFAIGIQNLNSEPVSNQHSSPDLSSRRQRSAMIVHNSQDAEKQANLKWVDPNSLEYQNVVLEHKINKH